MQIGKGLKQKLFALTPVEKTFFVLLVFLLLYLLGTSTISYLNTPPDYFPAGVQVTIEEGMHQTDITMFLKEQGVVRSSLYLSFILKHSYPNSFVKAGIYSFSAPLTTKEIAQMLVDGTSATPQIKITFPEGFSSRELLSYLPTSMKIESTQELESLEGYLFPDTYFVSPKTTLDELIQTMRTNFDEQIKPFNNDIASSSFTLNEVITLASLVEREAGDSVSKKIVAGILINRLTIGMPLQVDAVFDYLFDKQSSELTEKELDFDSPYNTYIYAGLPPAPIANPGIESVEAVLYPTTTDYYYYLTAPDGTFYYAKNFEEHKRNKQKYLR